MILKKIRDQLQASLHKTSWRPYACQLMSQGRGFLSNLKAFLKRHLISLLKFLIMKLTDLCAYLEQIELNESRFEVDRFQRLENRHLSTEYRQHKDIFH